MPVPGLVPSILNNTYRLNFTINDQLQNQSFTFIPNDDDIPNEPDERGLLIIYRVSNGEVLEGDSADLIVIDDDTGDLRHICSCYSQISNTMTSSLLLSKCIPLHMHPVNILQLVKLDSLCHPIHSLRMK